GALANYGLAHWLGRAFFLRLGKYVLITERALDRSERYFAAHGEISTFLGRMLPVVRHLISIPAGIARMHLGRFVVFTGLGALVGVARGDASGPPWARSQPPRWVGGGGRGRVGRGADGPRAFAGPGPARGAGRTRGKISSST